MADNVIKQGFLRKAFAADNRLSGLWDKIDPVKWFIFLVRSGTPYLEYYDKENDVFTGDPINSFSLNGCQAVTYNLGRNTRNNFCIVLHDRVLELGCPSRGVMLDWCRTLERCLRQLGVLHNEKGEHIYTVCPAVVFSGRKKAEEAQAGGEGGGEGAALGAEGTDSSVQLRSKGGDAQKFDYSQELEGDPEGDYADCTIDFPSVRAHVEARSPGAAGEFDPGDTSGDFVDEDFFIKFKKKAPPKSKPAAEEEDGEVSAADNSSRRPVPAPRRLRNNKAEEETPSKTEDSNNNKCFPDPPSRCEMKEEGYLVMQTTASFKKSSKSPPTPDDLPQYVTADEALAAKTAVENEGNHVTDPPVPQRSADLLTTENTSVKEARASSPFENGSAARLGMNLRQVPEASPDGNFENPYAPFPVQSTENVAASWKSPVLVPPRRCSPERVSPAPRIPSPRQPQRNGDASPPPLPPNPASCAAQRQPAQEYVCPIPRIPPPLASRRGQQQQRGIATQAEAEPLPPPLPSSRPARQGVDAGSPPRLPERLSSGADTTQRKFASNYSLEDEEEDEDLEEDGVDTHDTAKLIDADLRGNSSDGRDSPPPLPPTLPPRLDSLPDHSATRLSPTFLRVQLPDRKSGASSLGQSSSRPSSSLEAADRSSANMLHSKNAAADETNPNVSTTLQSKNWAADETNPNMGPPLPPRPPAMLSRTLSTPPPQLPARSRTVVERPGRRSRGSDIDVSSPRPEPRVGTDGYLVQSSRQLSTKMKLDRSNSIHAVVSLKQSQVEILREQKAMRGIVHQLTPSAAANGLALVDILSTVWVAGWNQCEYPTLHGKFHVGDQLVSINKVMVENSQMAAKMLRSSSQVEVVVRRIPYGEVFAIKRSAEGERIGIHREGGTAEILYVDPNGLAAQHGLPPKAPMTLSAGTCNWFLTEINSRPLNLFFKDSEIEHRLYAVGKEISIVVQPSDFIFELRKKLKKQKNYKSFVVQ